MKKILYLWLLLQLGVAGTTSAQTIRPEEFLSNLAQPDPFTGKRVAVSMSGELSAMLNRPSALDSKTVEGYRVYIYNDNHQYARDEAQRVLTRFQGLFPDIPGEIAFDRPSYYKVAVGLCLTKDEVMMVFGRVKEAFPSAYVRLPEKLPLSDFLTKQVIRPSEVTAEE